MSSEHVRLHAYVAGMVQGVGFRYFTLRNAQTLKLTGWVRNLYNGEVEVMAEGPRSELESLVEMLQKGPSGSRVTGVRAQWLPATGEFYNFNVAFG